MSSGRLHHCEVSKSMVERTGEEEDERNTFVNLEPLDPPLKKLLLEMDLNDDGQLSYLELRAAVTLFRDTRKNTTSINYLHLPEEVRKVLSGFDMDQ